MSRVINCPEMPNADFGVDLSGVESAMPEELLDAAQVGTIFQHVGRAAVAE